MMNQRSLQPRTVLLEERATVTPAGRGRALLEAILDTTAQGPGAGANQLSQLLNEPSPWRALVALLGPDFDYQGPDLEGRIARLLNQAVARLDELLSKQVNAILHHPRFQKLEASWRGLSYLVEQVPEGENVKIRVLNISWAELVKDLDRALEFDQSQLFRKVYEDEFGMPGGEPFGALLGDYEIRPRPSADHPTDDVDALRKITEVAAASFAPFIAAAHPSLFGLDRFTELERPFDLARLFDQLDYLRWRSLRDTEDSRYLGLVLPRVLMRLPYPDGGGHEPGFRFREEVGRPDRSEYLWGNAVYAFGGVLIRAFTRSGWLAAIRGVKRGLEAGGLATGLAAHHFTTDRPGVAPRSSTDAIITDALDKDLGDLGLLPLSWCPDTEESAFHGSQSLQKPKVYDEMPATMNARLSAMLQYIFCVSRFAHYLKVIGRDRIGGFHTPADCEDYLRKWLLKYTNANDSAGDDLKARHPLREARVKVEEIPGRPGAYRCVMHLRPQFQLEQMLSAIRLVTTLTQGQVG